VVAVSWIVIVAVGVGSYLLRVLPLFVGGKYLASPRAERIIAAAGAAALAGLIVTGLDRSAGTSTDVVPTWTCAATALAAAVMGWSMQRVLAVGAVTYAAAWALMSVLG
jgi:branched-subunit amino acid transport protein